MASSSSSSGSPPSSSSGAQQQQQQPWATADDWATFRPIITQHYRDDNMKLKELIVFMDKTYGFKAT